MTAPKAAPIYNSLSALTKSPGIASDAMPSKRTEKKAPATKVKQYWKYMWYFKPKKQKRKPRKSIPNACCWYYIWWWEWVSEWVFRYYESARISRNEDVVTSKNDARNQNVRKTRYINKENRSDVPRRSESHQSWRCQWMRQAGYWQEYPCLRDSFSRRVRQKI